MRIGIGAFLGGMMTRTPEWRQPRMAPPRASTMKLTKNLGEARERLERAQIRKGGTLRCFFGLMVRDRLHLRFGCAVWVCVSPSHAFSMSFLSFDAENDFENACDGETHT
jgi:hypothetical protein